MEEFVFRLLDRYGVSIVVVIVLVLIVWKAMPEVVKVWIDKIRAETALIQATQDAVTTKIPAAIGDLKTTFIAEHKNTVSEIKGAIGADTDRRIEGKIAEIAQAQNETARTQAKIAAKLSAEDSTYPPPSVGQGRQRMPSHSGG
jgi:hypothetical protein